MPDANDGLNDRNYRRKDGEGIDYMEVLKSLTAKPVMLRHTAFFIILLMAES